MGKFTCVMPGCKNVIFKGSRLCEKHLKSGNDLRVPVTTLDMGLPKIYQWMLNAYRNTNTHNFNVTELLDGVDPSFVTSSPAEQERKLNDMAKLCRTLRANGFLVKEGHRNGFVCFSVLHEEQWDLGVVVSIDEQTEEQAPVTP